MTNGISSASRIRVGQGICVPRQGILGHFRPLLDIFRAKGLLKDTFLFEGRGCIPLPPLDAPLQIYDFGLKMVIFGPFQSPLPLRREKFLNSKLGLKSLQYFPFEVMVQN